MNIKELKQKRNEALDSAKAIKAKADGEDRPMNDDECTAAKGFLAEVATIDTEIDEANAKQKNQNDMQAAMDAADERSAKEEPRLAAHVDPQSPNQIGQQTNRVTSVSNSAGNDLARFSGFGDMLQAVARAGDPNGAVVDPRLAGRHAAITGHNESVGSEGGFLVGTDDMTDLLQRTYNNTVLLNGGVGFSGAQRIPISSLSNGVKINSLDETSRADGSRWGGIRAYWAAEGEQKTASEAKFKQISLDLKKLIGLAYSTDELLQDATALAAVISSAFVAEFSFKIQKAMFSGIGGGVPLGILNAPAMVTVAAEGGQSAATIVKENIDNMWSRMWPSSISNSVWFINQNVYPALFSMTQDVGTGGAPVYLPPGGLSVSPFGTLMGRPVVPIEQCETLGTKGDIVFADMSQYLFADKSTMASDSSIHVRFLFDETVFRFVVRVDGRPAWHAPLTPFKGTAATVSPFITLATRS